MVIELKQTLRLTQQLVMTPQLQQAIKLLQLNRMELTNLVERELQENPVLEEDFDADAATPAEVADATPGQEEAPGADAVGASQAGESGESLYADTGRRDFQSQLEAITRTEPSFICLNVTGTHTDIDLETQAVLLRDYLERGYPDASPFER